MMRLIKAVIFDMDGTITAPLLDFPAMKAEIGIPEDVGLLESLSRLDRTASDRAEAILLRHELAAAVNSRLNDGADQAVQALRRSGFKTAILTRNCRAAVDIVLEKHALRFDAVVTREDCLPKPHPDGLHTAAELIRVPTRECVMVGDYEFDIQAGRAAGAVAVLFAPDGHNFQTVPDFEITSMEELVPLVRLLNKS